MENNDSSQHECTFPRAEAIESANEIDELLSGHDWKLESAKDYAGGLLAILTCEKCNANRAMIINCPV